MHSVLKIVKLVTGAIGTPLAHKAVKLLGKQDYATLVGLEVHPRDYSQATAYKADAQVVALFRKLDGLPTGIDLHKAALNAFYECEEQCRLTNARWATYESWFSRGFAGDAVDFKLYQHLQRVREIVASILGPVPKDLVPRLSGGSTFYDKGDEITIPHKMSARPSVTQQGWETVQDLWRGTAWWRTHDFAPFIVRGNRFTSVPKDSKKNRGICVEPSLLVGYQLSLGAHIRDALLWIGIDIKGVHGQRNAQRLHRHLAKVASVTGKLATLDLSNASDTIAYMLVKTLLPKGWFDLLASLRSPETYIGGKWVKLHKFSSMGNGFTFELETLLFYALAKSVSGEERCYTYGDDIILPGHCSQDLRALLALAGFTTNAGKSFDDPLDPFRESCGGDFFSGSDVRPIFLKSFPQSPVEWMTLANQITLIARSNREIVNNRMMERAWNVAVSQIPKKYRVYGPLEQDGCIHTEDMRLWRTREAFTEEPNGFTVSGFRIPLYRGRIYRKRGYCEIRVLRTQQKKVKLSGFTGPVQLASALLGTPSEGPVPRDGIAGYRLGWASLQTG